AMLLNVASFAQTTSGQTTAVDLTAPSLQVHATLTQNNHGGTPLAVSLGDGRAMAASRGIPWNGLQFVEHDEVGGGKIGGPSSDTALLQLYQRRACLADLIVVGHTTLWVNHLSALGTTVYGDY